MRPWVDHTRRQRGEIHNLDPRRGHGGPSPTIRQILTAEVFRRLGVGTRLQTVRGTRLLLKSHMERVGQVS